MEKEPKYYIAYGSNLNLPQMGMRCPTANIVGTAEIKNHQLLFRGNDGTAVATVEPKDGSSVPVLIWDILPNDEKSLDRYEGHPWLYRKENVQVEFNGEPVETMVYIMNDIYDIAMPSQRYFDTIKEGYKSAGFDEAVLDDALQISIDYTEQKFNEPTM